MLKAILFDLGDTVFGLDPLPADLDARVDEALAACGVRGVRGQTVLAEVRRLQAAEPLHAEPKLEDLFAKALRSHEVDAPGRADQLARVLHLADVERFHAPPRLRQTLVELASDGLRLGVVSNTTTPPVLIDGYLHALGVRTLFETCVYSVGIGRKKPSPEPFRAALREIDVGAGEALYIGDRPLQDIRGATSIGMKAVITHQFRREDPGYAGAHAVINQLAEIVPLVRSLRSANGG